MIAKRKHGEDPDTKSDDQAYEPASRRPRDINTASGNEIKNDGQQQQHAAPSHGVMPDLQIMEIHGVVLCIEESYDRANKECRKAGRGHFYFSCLPAFLIGFPWGVMLLPTNAPDNLRHQVVLAAKVGSASRAAPGWVARPEPREGRGEHH